MLLDNKVAIVTGGAQGIGFAIARRYLEEGARVVIADIDGEAGARAAAELSVFGQIRFIECDVSERLDVRNMVATTIDALGDIDVLVNNAAILVKAGFLDLDPADFERVLRVNLMGAFLCSQAVARHMVERIKAGGVPGTIINLSSVNALFAIPDQVPYSVSKGGLTQLTRVMALALASLPDEIRGFGHIKAANMAKADIRRAELLTRFEAVSHAQTQTTPGAVVIRDRQRDIVHV